MCFGALFEWCRDAAYCDGDHTHLTYHERKRRTQRAIFGFLVLFLLIGGIACLIFFIAYTPKPQFTLQDLTVFQFNTTNDNTITSSFQATFVSKNPSNLYRFYYKKLDTFITYRDQTITDITSIRPEYQGHKDVKIWSPFIYGDTRPIAPSLATDWIQDRAEGAILVKVKILGRVSARSTSGTPRKHNLYVDCPVHLSLEPDNVKGRLKFLLGQDCTVAY